MTILAFTICLADKMQVCELDLIFHFHKAYYILDELLIAGEMQETSKQLVLRTLREQDAQAEAAATEGKIAF
jgi:AP-1 complex subunit sigma 1/2